jgi:hypothetical protein
MMAMPGLPPGIAVAMTWFWVSVRMAREEVCGWVVAEVERVVFLKTTGGLLEEIVKVLLGRR